MRHHNHEKYIEAQYSVFWVITQRIVCSDVSEERTASNCIRTGELLASCVIRFTNLLGVMTKRFVILTKPTVKKSEELHNTKCDVTFFRFCNFKLMLIRFLSYGLQKFTSANKLKCLVVLNTAY
jgi:hypothetical protein